MLTDRIGAVTIATLPGGWPSVFWGYAIVRQGPMNKSLHRRLPQIALTAILPVRFAGAAQRLVLGRRATLAASSSATAPRATVTSEKTIDEKRTVAAHLAEGKPHIESLKCWYYRTPIVAILRSVKCFLPIAVLFSGSLWAQNTRNVLVLHEGNVNHPANVITSAVFREAFGSGPSNQFFEEYIDEDRLGASNESLVEVLRNKYAGKKMNLVIGDGRPALKLFLQYGEEIWPGTPEIFYFVDSRELPAKLPPNMTGVASTIDYGAILDLALQLKPNTRQVFYVGGVNSWEELWRGFAEDDFKRFAGRVEVTYLNDMPLPDLLDRLARLPANSAVIYSEILRDASGHVYVPARVCPLIAAASNAPVYGPFDTYVGCGIVGGVILDIRALAKQTASLGLRVLERGTAAGLPVETSTNHVVVDWRQLERWRISEESLPSGTAVLFRPPSLWEQHKEAVLADLAAIIAELALIAILLIEMRRRKKSELAIKDLGGRLINAGEEERKRIARELHDDIGQRLSLVAIELDVMRSELPVNRVAASESLGESLQQLNEIVTDVHNLSHQLHSSKLQVLGLEVALKAVCQQIMRQHELQIHFTADNIPSPIQDDLGLCFYRVAQEALNNSVKHSRSARAEVRLTACNGTLRMTVRDYGLGFDPSVHASGLGLATMRERLRLVGGNLEVASRPGEGTELTAQAPLVTSANTAAA